jgi:phosphoenolpyruvate carboxykinase (ATP)
MEKWWQGLISGEVPLTVNGSVPLLIERALGQGQGQLSASGTLVVRSGAFTGRAVDDKYVVKGEYSERVIDWSAKLNPMDARNFEALKAEVLLRMNSQRKQLYLMERSVGADEAHALGVRLITASPSHALFARHMFRPALSQYPLGTYTVYHDSEFSPQPEKYGLRNPVAIAINYESREIVVCGTAYAGEIKKSIFTVMNTLLPDHGIFPMHTGASMDPDGRVSLFFGLSGTGKTTLSTDVGMKVIGDDEHGLSDRGTFNFEGGCYAKTYKLSEESEPQIYRAVNGFGSMMENVVLDEQRRPCFDDKSITENGRASYPLSALESWLPEGRAGVPSHIFFLSADALGVLPAVSLLDSEQAMYYFLTGYTAKLAGTEVGIKGISTTFSHCFGAPFMIRRPMDYGLLLKDFLARHDIKVWLVNTGWYGGPYGTGERYSISTTRSLIRAIQRGDGEKASFRKTEVFNLAIPAALKGVESKWLDPTGLWHSPEEWRKAAQDLKAKFDQNYRKFELPVEA